MIHNFKRAVLKACREAQACEEGMEWLGAQPTIRKAWETCELGDWMLFGLGAVKYPGLVQLGYQFLREEELPDLAANALTFVANNDREAIEDMIGILEDAARRAYRSTSQVIILGRCRALCVAAVGRTTEIFGIATRWRIMSGHLTAIADLSPLHLEPSHRCAAFLRTHLPYEQLIRGLDAQPTNT